MRRGDPPSRPVLSWEKEQTDSLQERETGLQSQKFSVYDSYSMYVGMNYKHSIR
jgi:hypothetical protein